MKFHCTALSVTVSHHHSSLVHTQTETLEAVGHDMLFFYYYDGPEDVCLSQGSEVMAEQGFCSYNYPTDRQSAHLWWCRRHA